jgi:hypothetical protein
MFEFLVIALLVVIVALQLFKRVQSSNNDYTLEFLTKEFQGFWRHYNDCERVRHEDIKQHLHSIESLLLEVRDTVNEIKYPNNKDDDIAF